MAPNRQTMGIKHQILMVTLIPNLLLILVLAAYLVGTRVEELDKGFGQRGHDISQQVSTAVMPSLFAHRYDNLNLLIRETMELYPEVYSIHIKDQHGSEVAAVSSKVRDVSPDHLSKFDLAIAPATTTAELYRYSPEQALNISPGQPLKLGSVSVILDGSEKARKKWSIILNTLLLSLAGLTFSSLLAIFLSAKLAEPIERINRAMQRLREGDLKIRVGVNAKGEIGDLQQGFNEMASDIATANENMLMQVDQATRDLQASMEVLEIKNVELDLARKRALNVSRFKSEFLANMSHEIRTPMNGIIGFTNLLAKSNLDKTQSEYIKTIKASAANLLTIINDILDLSKLEAGKLKLETAPFSLRECIENAVSLLAPLAHEKQLELVSIVYNDLPDRLIGDQTRIAQILTNLVNNAIKFTSEGEIVLRTMLEKEDRSTVDLTISVSDTGVGVQPLEQEAIFSAFQQGENVSSVGGTGLGLSICKRLASAMGGDIALTSTPGQGSCFNVTLRLNKDNEFQSFDKPGFPFAGRRALLIDTHHASRMVVRNDLIDLGFQVEDREFSLDKSPPPDSLFDLFVIGLDGTSLNETSVIKHVQRMFRSQQVPSILLASCSNQENLDRLEITEADLVRGKPIKRTVLRECVNSLLVHNLNADIALQNIKESVIENPKPSFFGACVLVADDNEINRQLIVSLLSKQDIRVIEATNGQEAVELVRSTPGIALVLMDIHMPIMDGFEATRFIRNELELELPIVALTADVMEKNRNSVANEGFNGYLVKPLDDEKLSAILNELIEPSANNREGTTATAIESENLPASQESTLPARDIEKAILIAGGSREIADKLYGQLLASLKEDYAKIIDSLEQRKWDDLWQQLHRLQGSTSVCGVPALHQVVVSTQSSVKKQNIDETKSQLNLLKNEIERLPPANHSAHN